MRKTRATRVLAAAAGGYLVGTFPSAGIAARVHGRSASELRSDGTRNPGGMNVKRLLGRRTGVAVAAADVAKGAVACGLGRRASGDLGAHVAGVASVLGHCYPLWSRFRGGKGVATSFGQCLYTFPAYAPLDVAVAVAAARVPRASRPALVSVGAASTAWVLASVVWWRGHLPNLWGPRPSLALPLANAATALVIATRALAMLRSDEPDELALPR